MAKTKKSSAATAADPFFDTDGHPLAVDDLVRVSWEGASIYNGRTGTITGLHREGANAVATVAFKGNSRVPVGSQNFFLKWLTYQPAIEKDDVQPWLDCDGNELLEGDKATVLPDVSKRLSGKLVQVLGDYDAQKKSVQVEPVGWEGEPFGILLCYLKRLPVLGENLDEPLDPYKLPHYTEVRAEQDQERATRRQEPVAPFALAGQAAHKAAQASTPEPHRVGWATKEGSQLNHHYDAQGATACGYKRKSGALSFASEPDKLPRWQRCEKCDGVLTPAPAATEPTAAPAAKQKLTPDHFTGILDTAAAGLRVVPLASIVVTTNTRKVFDETALAELAESVKAHGILQPIVLRPHSEAGQYELVAGGRRYRAAQLAGLAEVPATVRNLTDREFLEVQLLENLQRVDVRPADEATAFAKLLGSNFSVEEIALKVGKPEKFVLQRAKLSSLIPNWFEKLENGTLELAAAHELARLPVHSQLVVWRKADEEIKANGWRAPKAITDAFKKSYVRELIEQEVLRDLSTAIWPLDDATLDLSAGACTQCPKRSSCQGLLFAAKDPDKDRCLDGVCFAGKRTKYLARRVREVTAELGTEPLQVSSWYSPEKKEGAEAVLGTKDFNWSRVDMAGAVPAVLMDGNEAGELRYVLLRQVYSSNSTTTKEERAASMRNTRTKRVTNELLAGDLRDLFAQSLPSGGAAANALLNHFLNQALTYGYSRIPTDTLAYLVASHGWAAPSEQDLSSTYVGPGQPSGHQQYINQQLDAMPSVLAKVVLYFDLKKFRNGLEQKEPTHAQRALLAALPKDMQQSLAIEERAATAVDERFYQKKGKKQEVPA